MTTDKRKPESDAARTNAGGDAARHLTPFTKEERQAVFALGYSEALDALEKEDPAVVAVATEYILDYSEKVGELLKNGKDYLALLTPGPAAPAIERIAMEVVLETVEEELAQEDL